MAPTKPPAPNKRGKPQWPEALRELMSTGEWKRFGPYSPTYARNVKWRMDHGLVTLPDETKPEQWEMAVTYVDHRRKQTTARAAHQSYLWVRWAGRRRRARKAS